MDDQGRTLVIADGGLCSLVACACAREAVVVGGRAGASRPVALICPGTGAEQSARARAAARHAELFDLEPATLNDVAGVSGEGQSRLLLTAGWIAAGRGLTCVVWPVQAGTPDDVDLPAAARASDRALLIARLMAIDSQEHGVPGLRVVTPWLDLTDHQLADLAMDMELPVRECWWWRDSFLELFRRVGDAPHSNLGLRPEEASGWREFQRWITALRSVGAMA